MKKSSATPQLKRLSITWRYLILLGLVILGLSLTVLLGQIPASSQTVNTPSPTFTEQMQSGERLYRNQQYVAAAKFWQSLLDRGLQEPLNQAMVWSNLSLTYQQLGQWQAAEQALTTSLQLLNTVSASGAERDRVLAATFEIQGRLHLFKGQPHAALATWQQANQIYQRFGNTAALIQNQINQAQALQYLGNQLLAQKELTQVKAQLESSPDSELKVIGLRSLGSVSRQLGELAESRQNLLLARQTAQQLQQTQLETEVLLDLGSLEYSDAKRAAAIAQTEDAKRLAETAHGYFQQVAQRTTQTDLRVRAILNDVDLLIEDNLLPEDQRLKDQQLTLALQQFATLLNLIDTLPVGYFSINARLRYAKLGMELIEKRAAISRRSLFQQSQTALQQAQQLQNPRAEAQALKTLGTLYLAQQQWQDAQQVTESALAISLQHLNASDLLYELQWQLGQIVAQLHPNQPKRAIAYYQNAIKALEQVRLNLMPANPDVQFSFRDQVAPVYRQLVELLLQQPTPEHLRQSAKTIDALQVAELEDMLRCPVEAKVALETKVDSQTAILHSIILPDQIVAIFEYPAQGIMKYAITTIEQSQVENILESFRKNARSGDHASLAQDGSKIYQWLIQPFASELETQDIRTLVFTLDGVLKNIPISVLYDQKRQEYLVQKKYAIALTPGLRLFERTPLLKDQMRILAAGVSETPNIQTPNRTEIKPLPYVKQELAFLQQLLPGRVKQLVNAEFTKTAFRQQINTGDFSIIHLASHGAFSSNPEETYLVTFNELIKSEAWNNLLKVSNQVNFKPVDLLVMSACETARGDRRAVLGLTGIAVRSGVRSAVSSLWQVNDAATAKLMQNFYTELLQPDVTRAEALHRAQATLFNDPTYRSSELWAAFVLVGNWL